MNATSQPTGADLRRTPRRQFRRPIGLMTRGQYFILHARQLSEGGTLVRIGKPYPTRQYVAVNQAEADEAFVLTLDDFPIESTVLLTFTLPSGFGIIARAKVIYHESALSEDMPELGLGLGLKFDDAHLPLNHRRQIRNYVSSKQASETSDQT